MIVASINECQAFANPSNAPRASIVLCHDWFVVSAECADEQPCVYGDAPYKAAIVQTESGE